MKHFFLPIKTRIPFVLCALLLTALTLNAQDLPLDNNGWSIITTSSDSRVIYCSSSAGNDSNNGLSSGSPVKTLNQAFSLVRDGYPDHVYLKRGDTWKNQTFQNLNRKSGRSSANRIVVAYYGSGSRPLVKIDNQFALSIASGSVSDLAIIGIEFYNYTVNPTDPDYSNPGRDNIKNGIHLQGSRVSNFLLEDCKLSFFRYLINIFNKNHGGRAFSNIDIRRNILVNAYNPGSSTAKVKSQGMFISHTKDLLIEENFMDHNGWYQRRSDSQPNQYNHNIYLSSDNEGPCVVRGNVLSRGAAHGLQLRSGGTAKNNAFIGNAVGMNVGYDDAKPTYYSGSTLVSNNVVTDGRPQVPNDFTNPQTGAIWGIWKQSIDKVTVNNNIVANIQDDRGGNVRPYEEGLRNAPNALGTGNIGWNWNQESFPAADPGWTDPTRDKERFAAFKNYTSYQDWVNAASRRGIKTWPSELTAYDYINYIRAGFNKSPVARPQYGGGNGGGSSSPIMHWKFNGDGVDENNRNYAKLQGGVGFTTSAKEGSQALFADGVNDWADIDNAGLETSFSQRTVAFWVDFDTRTGSSTVYEEGGSTNGFGIRCQNEVLQARAKGGSKVVNIAIPYTYTGWEYIAVVFDGGNLKLYRNGNLVDEASGSLNSVPGHSDPAGIAKTNGNDVWGAGSGHFFHGKLDDFRVYQTALAQSQIQALYDSNARRATSAIKEPTPVAEPVIPAFRTYPNPASEQLTVEGSENYQLTLYDMTGRAVLQRDQLRGVSTIDVRHLRTGIYLIRLRDGEQPEERRPIVIE